MENKAQHYVPRFYLDRFVDPETRDEHTPSVWVHDRAEAEPYARAPKKLAVRSFYYSIFGPDGARDDTVDEVLQDLENRAAPILARIDRGVEPAELSESERAHLSFFIAMMSVRTPNFRDRMEQMAADVMKNVMQVSASQPEYFERTMRAAMAEAGRPMPRDVEGIRKELLKGDYNLSVSPVFSLQMMVAGAKPIAEFIFNFNWRVLEAPPHSSFLTSDTPVVLVVTRKPPAPWLEGAGWLSPYMEATFPLSPRRTLLISLHHESGVESVTDATVREANLRTAAYAQTQVYGSTRIDFQGLNRPVGWEWWRPLSRAFNSLDRDTSV